MKLNFIRTGSYCLFLLFTFSSTVLNAGVSTIDGEGVSIFTSGKSWVSEYVANDAGCGASNILTLRAMVEGNGTIEVSGTAASGRDFALLNPTYSTEDNKEEAQDFLLHIFDDAVLEGDETIILTFPDGLSHTVTISDNESSVIVGNSHHVLSDSWPFFRLSTPIATASVTVEAALGPLETVYFMTRDGNGVMGKITNLSNHDFGCVTVENLAANKLATYSSFSECLPRIFSVTPTNPNPRANYQVTWYLTDDELSDYSSANAQVESEISIFKDGGASGVKSLIGSPAEVAWVAGGKALTATFKGGFGRFGVGFKALQKNLYEFYQEQYRGTQLRPVDPTTHQLRNSSQRTGISATTDRKIVGQYE